MSSLMGWWAECCCHYYHHVTPNTCICSRLPPATLAWVMSRHLSIIHGSSQWGNGVGTHLRLGDKVSAQYSIGCREEDEGGQGTCSNSGFREGLINRVCFCTTDAALLGRGYVNEFMRVSSMWPSWKWQTCEAGGYRH